ncbi:S8 family serine peptidase [Synechococcus sp. AH-551-E05]|nr:S8 family serine peptidase [Synechococcus sp. AH-551-E05]MDB4651075.1 S8 family serine peptidase [Synechococcus sp. AH-551-E05]
MTNIIGLKFPVTKGSKIILQSLPILGSIKSLEQIPLLSKFQSETKHNGIKSINQKSKNKGERQTNWFENLDNDLANSIEYFSNTKNFNKQQRREANQWVAASTGSTKQAKKLINQTKLKRLSHKLDAEGFDTPNLNLHAIKPSSDIKFQRLQKKINKIGGALWREYETISEPQGTIDARTINDPGWRQSWHLKGSTSTTYGVNAEEAWNKVTGEKVKVGIADSRHDLLHQDLIQAYPQNFDWDGDSNPDESQDRNGDGVPDIFANKGITLAAGDIDWPVVAGGGRFQSHGTAVSGIAIGRANDADAIGVAPEAFYIPDLSGFNSSTNQLTASNEFYRFTDLVNHSWLTPADQTHWKQGTKRTLNPTSLASWKRAIQDSIQVLCAGNQRDFQDTDEDNDGVDDRPFYAGWDNTNNESMADRKVIQVAATSRNGNNETYSTPGANLFVAAPSVITTSDVSDDPGNPEDNRGYRNGNIITTFNGTSAATPVVTGTIALMLESNPRLKLRDIQHILAQTSQKNGLQDIDNDGTFDTIKTNNSRIEMRNSFIPTVKTTSAANPSQDGYNTGWFQNGAGHWVSDSFGFGVIDANEAVKVASTWKNVNAEIKYENDDFNARSEVVPEGNLGGLNSLKTAGTWDVNTEMRVEWVEVSFDLDTTEQDELMVSLKSPSGTQSVLIGPGGSDNVSYNRGITLRSSQFWDEKTEGQWRLEVLDVNNDNDAIKIKNPKINIFGTCRTPSELKINDFDQLENQGETLESLAKQFLIDGGLDEASFEILSVNQIGNSKSFGHLSNGSQVGLHIDEGFIFTSGKARDAIGPNDSDTTSTFWGNGGIPLLGQDSFDASGLDVRFKMTEDAGVQWKVQMGSEEYTKYTPSEYDDPAGLFLADLKRSTLDLANVPITNLLQGPNGSPFSTNGFSSETGIFEKYSEINPLCGKVGWEYDGGSIDGWYSAPVRLLKNRTYALIPAVSDYSDGVYDTGIVFGSV